MLMLFVLCVVCVVSMSVITMVNVSTSKKQNISLIRQSIEIEEKYVSTLKENSKNIKRIDRLEDECKKLYDTCIELKSEVEYLKEENRKINKTLEFYNMVAPNFKLDKSFTMKIVK